MLSRRAHLRSSASAACWCQLHARLLRYSRTTIARAQIVHKIYSNHTGGRMVGGMNRAATPNRAASVSGINYYNGPLMIANPTNIYYIWCALTCAYPPRDCARCCLLQGQCVQQLPGINGASALFPAVELAALHGGLPVTTSLQACMTRTTASRVQQTMCLRSCAVVHDCATTCMLGSLEGRTATTTVAAVRRCGSCALACAGMATGLGTRLSPS